MALEKRFVSKKEEEEEKEVSFFPAMKEEEGDQRWLVNEGVTISVLLRLSRAEYGLVSLLNKSFRSLIRSGEIYQLRRKMGVVEHWIYFACDLLEWEAFDPKTCRWMDLPPMPLNHCFMCSDKESLAVGTQLLVFGREIGSLVVYGYSLLTNTWSYAKQMSFPRCLFASASCGEEAIVAGGCDIKGNIFGVAELYNSETNTWETLPNMKKARKMCSGVFMDGKFYALGGIGEDGRKLTCGEEYDMKTKEWRVIEGMFPRGSEHINSVTEAPPLVAVVKDVLYAADYAKKELRKYVKESNTWVSIGSLPERSSSINGWGLAFRGCGDQLVIIGGESGAIGRVSRIIEINSWIPNQSGPPNWISLARSHARSNFVYNCSVMGC